MQFHLQAPDGVVVTGTGDGWIRVGVEEIRANVVLTPEAVIRGFAGNGFDALDEADFAALLAHRPKWCCWAPAPCSGFRTRGSRARCRPRASASR